MIPSDNNELSGNEKRIERATYLWNIVAGVINALQSVVILMVVTRVCDVVTAGVFTLAYANGNLFLNVGKYGMRLFQSSDRPARYSFADYRMTRFITTALMLATGGAYLAFLALTNGYTLEKAGVIGIFCLYEAVTAFEDVYHGNFQQHGRLDVASMLFTIRIASTIALMCLVVGISRSLLIGAAVATVYTACFMVGEFAFAKARYGLPIPDAGEKRGYVVQLLKTCFPLFAAAFLLFYIGNAPRYAIDSAMGDAAQAYYGYIAMPVFVVSLLAGFIYNPMITSLTDQWRGGRVRLFLQRFAKAALAIGGITAACDTAALVAGVPVLNVLYNADTAPYLGDLIVLVTGGGFLALASLAVLGVTIIRYQRVLVPAYVLVAVVACLLSGCAVGTWGVDGAAWTYFASMALLAVLLTVLFLVGIRVCGNDREH